MRVRGLTFLFVLAAAPGLFGSACVVDFLTNYEALGATGCQVGPFTVNNFSYTLVASTVNIPDTDITVTPVIGAGSFGLMFSSPDFDVTGNDFARYLLAYTWDPGDIRSLEDVLNTSTPVFPGVATITTDACEDSAFTGATCPTTDVTLVVFSNGNAATLTDTVGFSPGIGTVGIRDLIDMEANGASSEFTSFLNIVSTPEPSTLAEGLIALALITRRLCKRG